MIKAIIPDQHILSRALKTSLLRMLRAKLKSDRKARSSQGQVLPLLRQLDAARKHIQRPTMALSAPVQNLEWRGA